MSTRPGSPTPLAATTRATIRVSPGPLSTRPGVGSRPVCHDPVAMKALKPMLLAVAPVLLGAAPAGAQVDEYLPCEKAGERLSGSPWNFGGDLTGM